MKKANRVIAVGFDQGEHLSDLMADLKVHGFELIEIPTADALTALLAEGDCAVILAYKHPDLDIPRQVLAIVEDAGIKTPVIVLVDRAEVEEYFDLMCAGAFDYFEVLHGPQLIERSVEYAAYAAVA